MDAQQVLEAAREWVHRGVSVIPLAYRDKRPDMRALQAVGAVDAEGKPTWDPFRERLPSGEELRQWFGGPRRNLAVVTTRQLLVVDFDHRLAYDAWLGWAACAGGIPEALAASTYRVHTSRGMHVYLRTREPVDPYGTAFADVKARGYVVAPPSVHPCGQEYVAADGRAPIVTVERLADVFPWEPEPTHAGGGLTARDGATEDPFEAATRAVGCGGLGTVARVKASVSVYDLLGLPRQRGALILCPLHNDHHPSFQIFADGGWKCHGCGRFGDVVDLYAALHGLTNRRAIAELASRIEEAHARAR